MRNLSIELKLRFIMRVIILIAILSSSIYAQVNSQDSLSFHATPNPFSDSTTFYFQAQQDDTATLVIYDVTGKVIDSLLAGELVSGRQDLTYRADSLSGVYYAILNVNKQREVIKLVVVTSPTSTSYFSRDDAKIQLYPNPTQDILNITSMIPINRVQLFNQQSQLILEKEGRTSFLNIQYLPKGTYFLRIETSDAIFSKKIFKFD